uniref:Uncharacterized protein n=1 Tax=Arundo donax TaxID=35708 RepID=A0A0A9F5D3_ARUDO
MAPASKNGQNYKDVLSINTKAAETVHGNRY